MCSETMNDYFLTDLVPLEKLQQIQDAFSLANRIASTITDVEGNPITEPSNHCRVCTMVRASEKGLANCIISGEHLGLEAARLMKPFHKECLSCGFSDAAAPILVNGIHVGNWLIGQYHVRNVDERRIREYSREIEVDEEDMVAAFHEMPKLSIERFENILSFLWLMANEISAMGYQNLIRTQQNEELQRVSKQLEQHKNELEDIVEERTAELLQARKMESIGTLAAGIAHEINTPIQYVRDNMKFLEEACRDLTVLNTRYHSLVESVGNCDLFTEEIAKIHEFEEEIDFEYLILEKDKAVADAINGLERIATIVKALKDFSHPGSSTRQPGDINFLIKNTVTVSRSEWKEYADVDLRLAPSLPPVLLLSAVIGQAVLHLIVNAAEAIAAKFARNGEKGTITISTEHVGRHVRVRVSDTGIGIPKTHLGKIFDPFFTTKSVGKGMGQGLSMVYSTIVEQHGGTLDVTSELGTGTEFIITLPSLPC
jgi:signal transduction histidine kinase